MSRLTVETTTYNATTSAFEALVLLTTDNGLLRIAAAFEAPLNTPDDLAEMGLLADAGRTLATGSGLVSRQAEEAPAFSLAA